MNNMNKEDKKLLLADLCARLPHNLKGIISYDGSNTPFIVEGIDGDILHLSNAEECYVEDFKPYLRPMSSMTEEEKKKVCLISQEGNIEYHYGVFYRCQDYLNLIHVDYRGLIEKGLAIEVTEENNPYKE